MATQPKSIKLFEIKGEDWMKGLSVQPTLQVGGIFKQASYFDPFEKIGVLLPSLAPTQVGAGTIVKTVRWMPGVSISGLPYFYGYADDSTLYQINALSAAVTDVSAQLTATSTTARGAIIWRNKFIYAKDTEIRANAIPVALASDIQLLSGLDSAEHPMCIAGDLNLYVANGNKVAKIVNEAGTTNNVTSIFALETGMVIRDLKSDGRYLIIVADANPNTQIGRFRATISFWDLSSGTLSQVYDLDESYLVGAQVLDGTVYVFGGDNMYVCNSTTYPKLLLSFKGNSTITEPPRGAAAIGKTLGAVVWGTSGHVYAYGNRIPGKEKIFYEPYNSAKNICVAYNGYQFWTTTDDTSHQVYNHFSGTTRNSATIYLAGIQLPQPFMLDYVKVVAQNAFNSESATGLDVQIWARDLGGLILPSQRISGTANQSAMLFRDAFPGNDSPIFEDIAAIGLTVYKTAIIKLEFWGTPVDPKTIIEGM